MANKYLDYDGVQRLVSKLKTYISNAVKVTGVKGNSESTYRTGNVNLTAANVGAAIVSDLSYTENLDNVTYPGFYHVGGSNNVTNKPSGMDTFGLIVSHNAIGDYYTQIVLGGNQYNGRYFVRNSTTSGWTTWSEIKFTDTVTTVSTTGSGNAITALTATNGAITATKGSTFLTSHQDISGKMNTPSGGTTGQVLTKTSSGYEWDDVDTLNVSVSDETLFIN